MASAALKAKVGRAYDKVRARFFDSDAAVALIKASDDSQRSYDEVLILDGRWWAEQDGPTGLTLHIVEDDGSTDFTDHVSTCTHVDLNGRVYEIAPSDTLPPEGSRVSWTIRADRSTRRSYYVGL